MVTLLYMAAGVGILLALVLLVVAFSSIEKLVDAGQFLIVFLVLVELFLFLSILSYSWGGV